MGTLPWVAAGLIGLGMAIAAFVPAANVFMWVGTELAERLLYLPTVGLTVTLATLLPPLPGPLAPWLGGARSSAGGATPNSRPAAGVE